MKKATNLWKSGLWPPTALGYTWLTLAAVCLFSSDFTATTASRCTWLLAAVCLDFSDIAATALRLASTLAAVCLDFSEFTAAMRGATVCLDYSVFTLSIRGVLPWTTFLCILSCIILLKILSQMSHLNWFLDSIGWLVSAVTVGKQN